MTVPRNRIRTVGKAGPASNGRYVLYWMTAHRRTRWNFALDHALDRAKELGRPLVVLEALRVDYPWASDRFHSFVMDGMAEHADACSNTSIRYYPYVEPEPGAGKGLLKALATRASLIVTDDYPAFFLPRALAAAAKLTVRVEAVDSNGLVPMRAAGRAFPTARSFRRFLQQRLPQDIEVMPNAKPLRGTRRHAELSLDPKIERRWPPTTREALGRSTATAAALPIDHRVTTCATGGSIAGRRALQRFLRRGLERYAEDRNHPDLDATSGLSAYLHFGHISPHEILSRLAETESWSPERLAPRVDGRRTAWWGMSSGAEAFLDQLVTWRELGFNMCAQREDHDSFELLPEWARSTLAAHERDVREHIYDLDLLARGKTHDPLWNAAQTQLVRAGRIHTYLRMLWGKKILEWTPSPREALRVMTELNNRYALDGRDPNSSSGILWVLGRYDRAWGPERPVFGKVRYMSSENAARKLRLKEYMRRYAPSGDDE